MKYTEYPAVVEKKTQMTLFVRKHYANLLRFSSLLLDKNTFSHIRFFYQKNRNDWGKLNSKFFPYYRNCSVNVYLLNKLTLPNGLWSPNTSLQSDILSKAINSVRPNVLYLKYQRFTHYVAKI